MSELNAFPINVKTSTKVLFINFGEEEEKYCLPFVNQFRRADVATELYPEAAKLKKQFSYADAKGIPFVVIAGTDEMNSTKLKLKNMKSGEEMTAMADVVLNTIIIQS